LNILQPVHLVAVLIKLSLLVTGRRLESLGHLPLLGELDVILVENHLLNVMGRHLPHKQGLHVALFESLKNLILEAEELQDLLEHSGRYRAFHIKGPRHLRCRLLCVHFNALSSIAELVQLAEDLRCLLLELLLQNFEGLLIVQFFARNNARLIPKERVDLGEEILSRAR
jgi:hypothetical protein